MLYISLTSFPTTSLMPVRLASFDEVQEYLELHLSHIEQSDILEKTDKTELYLLYINCLEVHMRYKPCFVQRR